MKRLLTDLERVRRLVKKMGLIVTTPARILTPEERAAEMQREYEQEIGLTPDPC